MDNFRRRISGKAKVTTYLEHEAIILNYQSTSTGYTWPSIVGSGKSYSDYELVITQQPDSWITITQNQHRIVATANSTNTGSTQRTTSLKILIGSDLYTLYVVQLPQLNTLDGHQYTTYHGLKYAVGYVDNNNQNGYRNSFQWGNPNTGYLGWYNYPYTQGIKSPSNSDVTKYNSIDGLTRLQSQDDVATVKWGSNWRTPTQQELSNISGVPGYTHTRFNKATYNGTDIDYHSDSTGFVLLYPCTITCVYNFNNQNNPSMGGSNNHTTSQGAIWSSDISNTDIKFAYALIYYKETSPTTSGFQRWGTSTVSTLERCYGFRIVPVSD